MIWELELATDAGVGVVAQLAKSSLVRSMSEFLGWMPSFGSGPTLCPCMPVEAVDVGSCS